MDHKRSKPQKRIDELLLLVTIYSYINQNGILPSAEALMGLKDEFAPSLMRIDTLRMWLHRHTGRVIRRVGKCRPYRYELNKQGYKRIRFLMIPFFKKQIVIRRLGGIVNHDMIHLHSILKHFAITLEERMLLFDLLLEFVTAPS